MEINDNTLIPFGKYKGEKLGNTPATYLLWLLDNKKCYGTIKQYIQENEKLLRKEVAQTINYKDCDATESDIY